MNRTLAMVALGTILVSGLVLVSALGNSAHAQSGKIVTVEIVKNSQTLKDKAYSPSPVKVQPGTTVIWKNVDSALHTVTSGKNSKDKESGKMFNGNVAPRKEFKFTFTKEGMFDYYCALHPTMYGKVVVDKKAPAVKDSGSANASTTKPTTNAAKGSMIDIVKGSVTVKDGTKAFAPNPLNVKVGTTVTWKNMDSTIHTIVSGKSSKDKESGKTFDSKKPIAPMKEFSFKFDKKGTFDYYCSLHPAMVGKVTVK